MIKYLIDTNIWLEVLLSQERSKEVKEFLNKNSINELIAISDFSLHSVLLILAKYKKFEAYKSFLKDIVSSGTLVVSNRLENLYEVIDIVQRYNLDFDDAYQYCLAKNYNLIIVSFDRDFDKTEIKRKTPADLI